MGFSTVLLWGLATLGVWAHLCYCLVWKLWCNSESASTNSILPLEKSIVLFCLVLVLSSSYCMLFPFGVVVSVGLWVGLFPCLMPHVLWFVCLFLCCIYYLVFCSGSSTNPVSRVLYIITVTVMLFSSLWLCDVDPSSHHSWLPPFCLLSCSIVLLCHGGCISLFSSNTRQLLLLW